MEGRPRYPDFIVGGAPKSGTSSLYFWLSAHPDICGSKIKEPYYFGDTVNRFNKNANYIEHGLEKYQELFSHCSTSSLAFEATAGYLYAKNAVQGLQELPETPKLIFLLRNPKDQMFSHYRMEQYRIKNVDEPLSKYIQRDYVRHMWTYSKSIPMWLKDYPKTKVLFLLFEELMLKKVETMKRIAEFLQLDPGIYEDFDFEHRNQTIATKSRKFHRLGLKIQPLIPHSIQRLLLPIYMKMNSSGVPEISPSEVTLLKQMKHEFEAEMIRVKGLLPNLPIDQYWMNR